MRAESNVMKNINIRFIHDSWVAFNLVQGYGLNCSYCFKQASGLSDAAPKVVVGSDLQHEHRLLIQHYAGYYGSGLTANGHGPYLPIAVGTNFEITKDGALVDMLSRILSIHSSRNEKAPIVIQTKGIFDQRTIEFISSLNIIEMHSIKPHEIVAIGDSFSDLPVFSLSENKFFIDPKDNIDKESGYPVISSIGELVEIIDAIA